MLDKHDYACQNSWVIVFRSVPNPQWPSHCVFVTLCPRDGGGLYEPLPSRDTPVEPGLHTPPHYNVLMCSAFF